MSLQIVLSHYLSHLRERHELDALWPEVLRAMGHDLRSRPQVGPNQAGVDIVSVGPDDEDTGTVFLWILKFGDVGRSDFYGSDQSILASVQQAYTNFIPHRLTPEERALPIRIVILSNGGLKQEIRADYAGLAKSVAQHSDATLDFWGMDRITPLIEAHVFDDTLLLAQGKSHLRAAAAAYEDTEEVVRRFILFTQECLAQAMDKTAKSVARRQKHFFRRMAAASMGYAVIVVIGRAENNLKPAVIAGEFLALRLWAEAVKLKVTSKRAFKTPFATALDVHHRATADYFEKIVAGLAAPALVARYRRNVVFYADLVFEEVGRLATTLLWMHHMGAPANVRTEHVHVLVALIERHTIVARPVLDEHGIDLSLAFAALIANGKYGPARHVLSEAIGALRVCLKQEWPLPVDSDLLEDAIAVHVTEEALPRQFFERTTLLPLLATIAGLLDDAGALEQLHTLTPLLENVTLERWQPAAGLETYTGGNIAFNELGVSRTLDGFGMSPADERAAALQIEDGASPREGFTWANTPWEALLPTSARLHRHPLPTWYLAALVKSPPTESGGSNGE